MTPPFKRYIFVSVFIGAGILSVFLFRKVANEVSRNQSNDRFLETIPPHLNPGFLPGPAVGAEETPAVASDAKNPLDWMVDDLPLVRSTPINYTLFNEEGFLTDSAVSEGDISKSEAGKIQSHLKSYLTKVKELCKEKVQIDEVRTAREEGIYSFEVPPFAEEGNLALREFVGNVVGEIGAERAAVLINSISPAQIPSGGGALMTRFSLQDDLDVDGAMATRWEVINPKTGKRVWGGMGDYEHFRRKFGDLVLIEKK